MLKKLLGAEEDEGAEEVSEPEDEPEGDSSRVSPVDSFARSHALAWRCGSRPSTGLTTRSRSAYCWSCLLGPLWGRTSLCFPTPPRASRAYVQGVAAVVVTFLGLLLIVFDRGSLLRTVFSRRTHSSFDC